MLGIRHFLVTKVRRNCGQRPTLSHLEVLLYVMLNNCKAFATSTVESHTFTCSQKRHSRPTLAATPEKLGTEPLNRRSQRILAKHLKALFAFSVFGRRLDRFG